MHLQLKCTRGATECRSSTISQREALEKPIEKVQFPNIYVCTGTADERLSNHIHEDNGPWGWSVGS